MQLRRWVQRWTAAAAGGTLSRVVAGCGLWGSLIDAGWWVLIAVLMRPAGCRVSGDGAGARAAAAGGTRGRASEILES